MDNREGVDSYGEVEKAPKPAPDGDERERILSSLVVAYDPSVYDIRSLGKVRWETKKIDKETIDKLVAAFNESSARGSHRE